MADIPVPEQVPLTNVVVTSAGQTVFAYDFRADEVDDMRANYYRADGSVLAFVGGVDFTVSGIGNPAGGTITLTAIADTAVGETMAIYRSVIIDRLTDFQRDLLSSSLNLEFDKAFMIMQELRRDVDASLRFPPGVDYSPLPSPDDKKVIGWDGRQLANFDAYELISLAGLATAAQGAKADTALQPNTGSYRLPLFSTAGTAYIPPEVTRVFVEGITAHFRVVASEPATGMKFQNAGRWFWLDEPFVYPWNFGVVEGVSSASATRAGLQMAIDYAVARKAELRIIGDYVINAALNIVGPINIKCGGRGSLSTGASHITALAITSGGVHIDGLKATGAGNGAYNSAGRLITALGASNGAGVAATRLNGVKITNCELANAGRAGVYAQWVDGLIVEGCYIHDIGYGGVEALSCNRGLVQRNRIDNISPGAGGGTYPNCYGAYASQINSSDQVQHPVCDDFEFSGNVVSNSAWEGLDCHGGNNIRFLNNTIINCGENNAGIAAAISDNESSVPIASANNLKICGNHIKGSKSYAIGIADGSATVFHKNVLVSENTIEDAGGKIYVTGINRGGIYVGSGEGAIVAKNTLRNVGPFGVIVGRSTHTANNAKLLTIIDNTFVDILSDANSESAAIRIDRTNTSTGMLHVKGNVVAYGGGTATYKNNVGLRVISTDTGKIRIGKNDFSKCATPFILTAAQAGSEVSTVCRGQHVFAATTAVATMTTTITLPENFSGNSLYQVIASIANIGAPLGGTNAPITCEAFRASTSQITLVIKTASGANFPAAGNVTVFWQAFGL